MATTMEQVRAWKGPALWSYGFRPFFLAAGLWAIITITIWVPWYTGAFTLPSAFAPVDWHIHELLFGYVPAVLAGFLLTAVPNWTGRLPVTGMRLIALFSLWLLARLTIAVSLYLPPWLTAAASLVFVIALAATATREIIASKNLRNLRVVILIALLGAAQAGFHAESFFYGQAILAPRFGIAAAILLISVIGGRIIPSFTQNWLARQKPGTMPKQFSRFDTVSLVVSAVALLGWCLLPALTQTHAVAVGGLLLLAGLLQAVRLSRWAPQRTGQEPLVWVLHVAYAFVPLGFVLSALAALRDDAGFHQASVHAWTTGAIGLMTLAVMTRATRGHTGHTLTAPLSTVAIYLTIIAAAFTRLGAALWPEQAMLLLQCAGLLWVTGFALFAVLYGPMLLRLRRHSL